MNERWWNKSDLTSYIKQLSEHTLPLAGGEHLTETQLMEETIFLGLRSEGIDLEQFRRRFSWNLSTENASIISELIQQGSARMENGRIRLTAKGYVLCDEICQTFH